MSSTVFTYGAGELLGVHGDEEWHGTRFYGCMNVLMMSMTIWRWDGSGNDELSKRFRGDCLVKKLPRERAQQLVGRAVTKHEHHLKKKFSVTHRSCQ